MRILYVEDNPANLFLVQRVARMGNHEVLNYTSGETALENFERDHPDLVLMDVQLAGNMTGLDVVRKLRGSGYHTPIIAVTAYAMIGDRERCIDAGCDDYLAKPLPVPKLVEIIKRYDPLQQQTADGMLQVTQPSRPTSEMPVVPVNPPQPPAPIAAASNHNAAVPAVATAAPAAPAAPAVTPPAVVEKPAAEVKAADAAAPEVKPAEAKAAEAVTPAPEVKPAAEATPAAEAKPVESSAAPVPAAASAPQPATAKAPELPLLDDEPEADPDAKTEPYKPIHIELNKEDKV
ncbi:MAG: response regulator [Anaerolineae bacterium]